MKLIVALTALALIMGCEEDSVSVDEQIDENLGTMIFQANGEDFARNGFTSEDGWRVDFEHVFVHIDDFTAYQVVEENQTALYLYHAGHPHEDLEEGAAHQALTDSFFVDISYSERPLELAWMENSAIGNYNRVNFSLTPAIPEAIGMITGYEGYSIIFMGTAAKDGQVITFSIKLDNELKFLACGPHHEDHGVLAPGGEAVAEATFHLDHIWGDADEGPADTDDDEAVNKIAIGFGHFAALATGDVLDVTRSDLEAMPEYDLFITALETVGHSGEAHCYLSE
jgi:hypothetical protein